MFLDPLDRAEDIVVIPPDDGRARQALHIRQRFKLGEDGAEPRIAVGEQGSAEREAFIGQQHARASPTGSQRCRETCGTGTNDQKIAMCPAFLIGIRVCLVARLAETGGLADQGFIDLFPEAGRPHEGLVVKAGAQERREQPVDRADIEPERGPAVLAAGVKPVLQLDHRGARVGFRASAGAGCYQRIGFCRTRREDAARAVIFEAAADELDAVGEQRRGQRIARMAGERLSVESEVDRAGAVDLSAGGEAMAAHAAPPSLASAASTTLFTLCVTVSRSTISQRRQPEE